MRVQLLARSRGAAGYRVGVKPLCQFDAGVLGRVVDGHDSRDWPATFWLWALGSGLWLETWLGCSARSIVPDGGPERAGLSPPKGAVLTGIH